MGDFLDFMKSNAGIATAANVASSGIGALMNWLSVSSTNDRNERLMREQWDRELRMWKMNNAYNDPAAQMERLRRAGINPALAYANGVENVSASSADVGNAADMKAFQMPVNPIAVDPMSSAQVELLQSQSQYYKALAGEKQFQNHLNDLLSHVKFDDDGYPISLNEDGSDNFILKQAFEDLRSSQYGNLMTSIEGSALIYDIALLTGSDTFPTSFNLEAPSETPNWASHQAALKGDHTVRRIAGEVADANYQAQKAENAGVEEYSHWVESMRETPFGRFVLGVLYWLKHNGVLGGHNSLIFNSSTDNSSNTRWSTFNNTNTFHSRKKN